MSRRDRHGGGRERYDERDAASRSRQRRSGFSRESSPKRSRRGEKPETEELLSRPRPETADLTYGSQRQPFNQQDAVLIGGELGRTESKLKSPCRKRESEKKSSEDHADAPSSVPTVVARSRANFQHDDKIKAGQVDRSFVRRVNNERGWRDSKDDRCEKAPNRWTTSDSHQRDRKLGTKNGGSSVWRHDGFYEMKDEARPPVRRRPSFRETRIPADSENDENPAAESNRSRSQIDHRVSGGEMRDGSRDVDRLERRAAAGFSMGGNRGAFLSRDRYRSSYVGRESFNGRQSYHPQSGRREEKWKHDLFDEDTKSPTAKNEDDQIARIEALLAS